MKSVLAGMTAIALAVAHSAAVAQAQPQAPPQQAPVVGDPNEVVCEKQKQLGSRLSTKRICKTRAQWAEERRVDRMEIEKAQTQVYVKGQ